MVAARAGEPGSTGVAPEAGDRPNKSLLQHITPPGILGGMGKALRARLRQERFDSPVQEAIFNVIVAAGHLRDRFERLLATHGLTLAQFNALRILRGAQPAGLPRCEIAPRLLERAPDVTRLVDRLVEAGYAERVRSTEDARQSIARITRKGLAVLERIEPETARTFEELATRLSPRDAEALSRLCEVLYEEDL